MGRTIYGMFSDVYVPSLAPFCPGLSSIPFCDSIIISHPPFRPVKVHVFFAVALLFFFSIHFLEWENVRGPIFEVRNGEKSTFPFGMPSVIDILTLCQAEEAPNAEMKMQKNTL